MILGGQNNETDREADGVRTTLDDLFRRAGVRHPQGIALIDPPNRSSFTDHPPRQLSYADADRAISALAARLRELGLQTDAVVAIQLPNTVESVIAVFGVLRAGMIAAPLPVLWRKQDMVAALSRVAPKAIITSSRIGTNRHVEFAMQAAAELFSIRFVCGFGADLPDGVVPLDDVFDPAPRDFAPSPARAGNAAAHLAVITFDVGSDGLAPVARNHMELIAGGLAVYRQGAIAEDGAILSAIPLGSFAGIALTLVPWLLSSGTLSLHHAFDPDTFAAQCRASQAIVLPGPVLEPVTQAGHLESAQTILALWRAPERIAASASCQGAAALIDVASFGEIGLLVARRTTDGMPSPFSCGVDTKRTPGGMLALRGPMVPAHAFPPGAEVGQAPHFRVDPDGFADTGVPCRLDRETETLTISGPPSGMAAIGGHRFPYRQTEALVADVAPGATIVALPDGMLGQRLAGSVRNRDATIDRLDALGVNPLISGAFRPRGRANAA